MTLDLPPVFVKNITHAFPEGAAWLRHLPDLLAKAAHRWDLTLGEPFLLSYNYVCAAWRSDGTPLVLKIGVPDIELISEMNTLRLYAGRGACRLLEADPDNCMLLLERLIPGTMLVTLKDEDRATEIAADVIREFQHPAPQQEGFLSLRGWFDGLKKLRSRFSGSTGPFPEKSVVRIEGMVAELFAEERPQVLLHGDFHHYNVLLSDRGWLVIDPKGVIGAAEYEVGPFLVNPWDQMLNETEAIWRTQRRIAILSERLGFDRQRMWRWAFCFSLLSAFWDLAEDGSGSENARTWITIFENTKV